MKKKKKMKGTYLGVINKEIGKGIIEGKMVLGQNLRISREQKMKEEYDMEIEAWTDVDDVG